MPIAIVVPRTLWFFLKVLRFKQIFTATGALDAKISATKRFEASAYIARPGALLPSSCDRINRTWFLGFFSETTYFVSSPCHSSTSRQPVLCNLSDELFGKYHRFC